MQYLSMLIGVFCLAACLSSCDGKKADDYSEGRKKASLAPAAIMDDDNDDADDRRDREKRRDESGC